MAWPSISDWIGYLAAALCLMHLISLVRVREIIRKVKRNPAKYGLDETEGSDLPDSVFWGGVGARTALYELIFFASLRPFNPSDRAWMRVSRFSIVLFFGAAGFCVFRGLR